MTARTHLHVRYMKPKVEEVKVTLRGTKVYIDMKRFLIQGAKPYDASVHENHNNFQGGYRCELVITSQPSRGVVVIDDYKMGFVYTANPDFLLGRDSFSFCLESALGQRSDSQCVFILKPFG